MWKNDFAGIAGQFEAHKTNLKFDLQMYIATTVAEVGTTVAENSITLATIDKRTAAMMDWVFDKMQSPEERELVRQNGSIEEVLKKPELLFKSWAKDEKGPSGMPMTLTEFEQELAKDVKTVLEENQGAFNDKFEALLQKAETTIRLEIDRGFQKVEDIIHAGPHDYINDKVFRIAYS